MDILLGAGAYPVIGKIWGKLCVNLPELLHLQISGLTFIHATIIIDKNGIIRFKEIDDISSASYILEELQTI